jgi:hypothetical protein
LNPSTGCSQASVRETIIYKQADFYGISLNFRKLDLTRMDSMHPCTLPLLAEQICCIQAVGNPGVCLLPVPQITWITKGLSRTYYSMFQVSGRDCESESSCPVLNQTHNTTSLQHHSVHRRILSPAGPTDVSSSHLR